MYSSSPRTFGAGFLFKAFFIVLMWSIPANTVESPPSTIVETRIVDPDSSFVEFDYVAKRIEGRWFLVNVFVDLGADGLFATLEAKAGQLLKE